MANQGIDNIIFTSSHPDIVKRVSTSGVILSFIMILMGVAVFISTFEMENHSSTISMALMVLGTALFLWGVFRLFWKSKEVVYLPTNSVTKEHSIFFDLKYKDALVGQINAGSFSGDRGIKGGTSGNIRMDVILSADKKFAAVQLFQFVPYAYQPITEVHYFTGDNAAAVASLLGQR